VEAWWKHQPGSSGLFWSRKVGQSVAGLGAISVADLA